MLQITALDQVRRATIIETTATPFLTFSGPSSNLLRGDPDFKIRCQRRIGSFGTKLLRKLAVVTYIA